MTRRFRSAPRLAVAAAGAALALAAAAAWCEPPPAKLRTLAIAEDQRRYADGVLKRFLADPDVELRARAALAVGRLQDSVAVPDLLPLLQDTAPEVRREAVFALGQIGHRSARSALEARLADPDAESALLAIEALGKLGDRGATAKVAGFLTSATPAVRSEAAVALWRLADSTALGRLLAAHSDADPEVRWRVLYALEKIVDPDRVVLIGALHLADDEWTSRAAAARTIGRQKSPRGVAYLVQTLNDADVRVLVNAIRGIQQIADSASALSVTEIVRRLGHAHPYVRVTAATALADRFAWVAGDSVTRRTVLDSLRVHLRDPDPATRGACGRALLIHLKAGALAEVTPLLADSSLYTRVAVIGALGSLPARDAVPLLSARLAPGTPLFERMTAAEALGSAGAKELVPALRSGLADSSALYVAASAGALAALGDRASVRALSAAYARRVAEADADARIGIRDALRELAGRAYADSLERAHPAPAPRAADYPDDFGRPPAVRGAVLHTSAGDVEWSFYGKEAPETVKNFVRLAERGYFDGVYVHRVVPNFVIQDGDPTGTGSGGPGYTIRCEYQRLRYEPGMVGMALSGKDTGGSQWFVTHSPQPHLNGRYTIFARVVRGMDVVERIVQGDRVLKVEILR
ncbi:MAG TPA: HEAT repeat domain-containing protein [Candidatus Limnocylindria bacterium]|nr:HEAT repeat domain-containing protein [Candidatus Limnocylindria bacterium]